VGGPESEPPGSPKTNITGRFVGFGLWVYNTREFALQTGGNVYYKGARPYSKEAAPVILSNVDPQPAVLEEGDSVYLRLRLAEEGRKTATTRVTTALLGRARVPGLPYENADGSPLVIDHDYYGKQRRETGSTAGPFEDLGQGELRLKVWTGRTGAGER